MGGGGISVIQSVYVHRDNVRTLNAMDDWTHAQGTRERIYKSKEKKHGKRSQNGSEGVNSGD